MFWTYSVNGTEEGENKTDCLMTCVLRKQNLVSIYRYTVHIVCIIFNNARLICYNK